MNKQILVVDDEPDIQFILKTYLERNENIEVISSLNGEDAVATYRKLLEKEVAPDLVVIDLNLSGSNEDETVIERHREGLDEKLDGVRTTRLILDMNPDAHIWGYTAWYDTAWGDKLEARGAEKIVGRNIFFKDFAEMVVAYLQS
jgi:DNA-binding NarL/FixJ family response regulator